LKEGCRIYSTGRKRKRKRERRVESESGKGGKGFPPNPFNSLLIISWLF
jgi:hypothetical protein